ncbi:MAG: helix-turn-helix transcriptional regulator [Clostridiales bacterium]|nr:helix-turn-helix transcriptional regulator [Clostridiales bacterium]
MFSIRQEEKYVSLNFIIIGRRVKESRLQNGMSQADLAEEVNMSVSYISRIETAEKKASLESLVRIANVLGVTVDYFLNGNQTNDPAEYQTDLARLIEGCTSYEKRVIYEIALATKKSLLENKWMQRKDIN